MDLRGWDNNSIPSLTALKPGLQSRRPGRTTSDGYVIIQEMLSQSVSEMGLRLKAALDSPLLLRRASCASEAPITEAEIRELEVVVLALRKQLKHLVDDELTSSMEACSLATDGLEMLRNELKWKRCQRDELQRILDERRSELGRIDSQYLDETELRDVNNHDVVRMKENTEKLRKDAINMRAEIKQMAYFQESVDAETKHRLRADVQNLELERERDAIKLRHLSIDRDKLRSELDRLESERDAAQRVKFKRHQELAEKKMTRDMYKVRQEALELHLRDLEGDAMNIFSSRLSSMMQSCRDLLKGSNGQELYEENNSKGVSSKNLKNFGMSRNDSWEQQYDRVNLRRRSRSPIPIEVGKVVMMCADDGVESSDLLALVPPTIFQMGDDSGDNNNAYKENRSSREVVEFLSDSSSTSAISALTTDDDAW